MKEYINKTTGEYRKTSEVVSGEQWVEIPDGAEKATLCNDFIIFWKEKKYSFSIDGECKWCYKVNSDSIYYDFDEYMNTYGDAVVLWQRTSLNDQYAEIEKVRQAQRENAHYFKDVSDIDTIDVYEVLKRFNVTDPCLQHLIKKALCVGNRGHKDLETDLRDILKTAKRALEINGFSL